MMNIKEYFDNLYKTATTDEEWEKNNNTCWNCPLKWHCALWLFDKWNVNKEMCNCTDERLIALDNPFNVDFELLNKWGQGEDENL